MKNYQINILTSINCSNRIDTIRETWGKSFNELFFYSDHEDLNKQVFQVTNERADYYSCALKTKERIQQIIKNVVYDWYVFVDDDTFVNLKTLEKFLSNLSKDNAYGRLIGQESENPYFAGGSGFIIPKEQILKIKFIKDEWLQLSAGFGDLLWAYAYKEFNIPLVDLGRHLTQPDTGPNSNLFIDGFSPNLDKIINTYKEHTIAIHPVRTFEEMNLLYLNTKN
jgi:hypothetical protein